MIDKSTQYELMTHNFGEELDSDMLYNLESDLNDDYTVPLIDLGNALGATSFERSFWRDWNE